MAGTGRSETPARNLLCITLALPLSKCLSVPQSDTRPTLADIRVEFSRREGEQSIQGHYIFICAMLPERSWSCCSGRKTKGAFSTGMHPQREPAAPAMGSLSGADPGAHARFARNGAGPIFFLLCQASPQLCRQKRRNNIVESRGTIGFKSIVHKEPISRSL